MEESRKSFISEDMILTKIGLDKYARRVLKCRAFVRDYILSEHKLKGDNKDQVEYIKECLDKDEVESLDYYLGTIKLIDFAMQRCYVKSKLARLRSNSK